MSILGHRDARERRKWGKGEIGYVVEHGSWGESWGLMGVAIDRSRSACANMFFRHATTHERACRERALEGGEMGRPANDADPIPLKPGELVGNCFGDNVATQSFGRIGRADPVPRGQSSIAGL